MDNKRKEKVCGCVVGTFNGAVSSGSRVLLQMFVTG